MDDRLRNWHPTQAEVREIVDELRPLIREMARRQQAAVTDAPNGPNGPNDSGAAPARRVPAAAGCPVPATAA